MSVRTTIDTIFQQVAREQQRTLSQLSNEVRLMDTGLDSLSFALIVARLEDTLGVDPFQNVDSFPVTFGDFVNLYENHPQ